MDKGDHTRELIIKQAAALFNTYGYSGCSLSDIMAATALQKGGIYNHFRNKDEIALAAFDYSMNKVFRRFRERLDQDDTATEKLYSIVRVFASFVKDPVTTGGCPIANTAVDATGSHPELRKRAREGFRMLENYITIKIEEGMEEGEFSATADPGKLAALFVSSLEGALMLSRISQHERHMDITVDFLERLIREDLLAGHKSSQIKDRTV